MKSRVIIVDNQMQELTEHGTDEFPLSMDYQMVYEKGVGNVLHWHNEIQISLVTSGIISFETPRGSFCLKKGDGIFIMGGCLHKAVPISTHNDAEKATYLCVNFDPRLIYDEMNSLIRQNYVNPFLCIKDFQTFVLRDEPWHKEICKIISDMANISEMHAFGYELELKINICKIWLLFVQNNRKILETESEISFSDSQRIHSIQRFIGKNYNDRLTLQRIAESAYISRCECCRLFQRVLHMSPIQYLISYRISQSIVLLSTSELNIAEIAQRTGFGSSSYFTECFKRTMGCKPLEFRKKRIRKEQPAAPL